MHCRERDGGRYASLSEKFDAVAMLGRSCARHIKSSQLTGGVALAEWCNRRGRVCYRAPHHHTLSYYVRGSNHLKRVRSSRAGSGKGTFSLLPAGHHSEWVLSGSLRFIHIYLDPAWLNQFAASALDRNHASVQLPEAAFVEDPYLDQLIRFVLCTLDWNDHADRLALSRVADLVMLRMIKHYDLRRSRVPVRRYSLAPVVERRVREFVETNLDRPLTIADLAAVAGLSRYHFARMFKQSTGVTVHAYVTQRRIAFARHLLSRSALPIADIADRCGFSSQSHFCRRFKTATGVAPSHYRSG